MHAAEKSSVNYETILLIKCTKSIDDMGVPFGKLLSRIQVHTPCPVRGKYCRQSVVYRADVEVENGSRYYLEMTKNEFKDRYREHKEVQLNA